MKVFMTGGTGFVGSYFARRFIELGHDVSMVVRGKGVALNRPQGLSTVQGDPTIPGEWQNSLADCDVVINLAGSSVFTRWTRNVRRTMMNSRILTTRNVVDGLAARRERDVLLVSASAIGYYGARTDDAELDENGPPGNDFLADLGRAWEAEAVRAEQHGVRVARCRIGIVLGKGGGALEKMIPPFRRGIGGPLGNGKQWFSWIHQEDLFRIMLFLMERKNVSGPVNGTAPVPVRNEEMAGALAAALGKTRMAPAVPGFMLKLLLGDFGDVVLKGQRVIPRKLLDEGFSFRFPTVRDALADLVQPG